jgi:murein peptide amidase A
MDTVVIVTDGRMALRRPPRRGCAVWSLALALSPTAACAASGGAGKLPTRLSAHGVISRSAQVRRTVPLGRSAGGRLVVGYELGDPASPRRILVVGCIHGDEPAGVAVARALTAGPVPANADLWVIPVLNPDGMAARTRGNAHGVDLNRNFPAGWRPLGPPGSVYFAGRGPLSEPESRLAAALIRRFRPTVGIWFHQQMAVVDTSQGPKAIERRFARQVGLPTRSLTVYPGSATGWENTTVPDSAFVVELPPGPLSTASVRRYVEAVRAIIGSG